MGCGQSKIENEEAVSRCKERKLYMKEAMSSRNAFAAAHSTYATYLKSAGAALTGYASGEGTARFPNTVNVAQQAMPPPPPLSSVGAESIDKLRPPPPPDRLDTLSPPLQRAATMPEIKIQKPEGPGSVATPIAEEEEGNESDDEDQHSRLRRRSGSNRNASVLEDVGAPPPVPRIPPEEVPVPSQIHEFPYDYFFSPDPMHTTTLSERLPAEEVGVRNEEIERKPVDEKPKKTDDKKTGDTGGVGGEGKGFESVVVERPPVKRGKQGGSVAEGKRVMKGKLSLQDIFLLLDDHFLKASETAHEVSKMLEATRLHYHSNFADNRGHIDHSSRVMRVITWNRSFKGLNDHDEVKDDFDSEEHETHATVLDKLLAWEKKLYDEVKAGELMKFEYQRKVASLNRLKKRGTNSDALEKAKAVVSHLHTRYIVDMQSMDSTVFEINRLRDEQLYPKLVQLVIGMATMWQAMREHHERQSELVKDLADIRAAQSQSPGGTSDHHHECTDQLLMVVQVWHSQFQKLVNHQKGYINALNKWLKLNLIPIESSLREKVSSPPRIQKPPIQELLLAWHNELDKLPDEDARTAIGSFAAAIKAIYDLQAEEIKQRQKCEETRKELSRKSRQFDDWYQKYMQRMVPGDLDPEGSDPNAQKELGERQFVVDQLKKKLEDEEEAYRGLCQHVREKSLGTFQNQLPLLFRKMADFADECSKMYRNVTSKSKLQRSSQSSS